MSYVYSTININFEKTDSKPPTCSQCRLKGKLPACAQMSYVALLFPCLVTAQQNVTWYENSIPYQFSSIWFVSIPKENTTLTRLCYHSLWAPFWKPRLHNAIAQLSVPGRLSEWVSFGESWSPPRSDQERPKGPSWPKVCQWACSVQQLNARHVRGIWGP